MSNSLVVSIPEKYRSEAMHLLASGKIKYGKGGLRWVSGEDKGRLFCLYEAAIQDSENDAAAQNIVDSVVTLNKKAVRQMKNISNQLVGLTDSVSSIQKSTRTISAFAKLSTVLTVADIGVSIVGFALLSSKIDTVKAEIEKIDKRFSQMGLEEKEQKYEHYILRIDDDLKDFASCKSTDDEVDYYFDNKMKLRNRLSDVGYFLSKIIDYFNQNKIDGETAIQIIYSLLAVYSNELQVVCKCHYIKTGELPPQYSKWILPFEKLTADSFQNALRRYFMLNYPEVLLGDRLSFIDKLNEITANAENTVALGETLGEVIHGGHTENSDEFVFNLAVENSFVALNVN